MKTTIRRYLNLTVSRLFTEKLRDTAHAYDVERPDGLYERCWGTIQVWCKPFDKPAVWDAPLSPGAWGPSELVGDLSWEWAGSETEAKLYVEVYARELFSHRRRVERKLAYEQAKETGVYPRRADEADMLSDDDYSCLLDWLEAKARDLIRLADLAPAVVGVRCPFCSWTLDVGQLLNDLVGHVVEAHPERGVCGLTLGEPCTLDTTEGRFRLEPVEDFSQ